MVTLRHMAQNIIPAIHIENIREEDEAASVVMELLMGNLTRHLVRRSHIRQAQNSGCQPRYGDIDYILI